jgi:hypothetical protein
MWTVVKVLGADDVLADVMHRALPNGQGQHPSRASIGAVTHQFQTEGSAGG